jgi:SH3 domain-containing protein
MGGIYGLNILSQFMADRGALLQYLQRLQPVSVVAMDDIGFTRQIKSLLPSAAVIHRQYHPRDHEFHTIMSPTDWLNAYAQFGQGNIYVQCLNEPQGYGDVTQLVNWCVEVMQLASGRGIRLALPSFAVGHPDSRLVANGAFDPLWRAFDRYPQHIYGCHEYAVQSTIDERPFRIGRFLDMIQRVDTLGLPRPRIIVTESGRDIGGGQEDGWKGIGWSEEAYAQFLHGYQDFYAAYNVSACIFCYGRGADGRWSSFDVEGANTLLSKLVEFNQGSTGQSDMVRVYKPNVTYSLNIRGTASTNAAIIGSVAANEAVILLEANVTAGWVKIRKGSLVGFVSLQTNLPFAEQIKVIPAA